MQQQILKAVSVLSATAAIYLTSGTAAEAMTIVADENFESGASGWSNNTTTSANNFSQFLGRFSNIDGTQEVFKTFNLLGNQSKVTIEFDFYEIDSWDESGQNQEKFFVFIDDAVEVSDPFFWGRYDQPTKAINLSPNPPGDLGFGGNKNYLVDQKYRYTLEYITDKTELKLGFGSTLGSVGSATGLDDESWGIDNVLITSDAATAVPTPAPLLGLIGAGIAAIKKKRQIDGHLSE